MSQAVPESYAISPSLAGDLPDVTLTQETLLASRVQPERTADPAEARRLLARDGCVVLTGRGASATDGTDTARAIFGDHIVRLPNAAEVRVGGDRDRRLPGIDHRTPLDAHTDGFSYGDRYPDHFLLLCAAASGVGGESFLVDGYALLDALAADPATAAFAHRLHTVPIDHTEPGMQHSVAPMVGRTTSGRRMLRRVLFQHPADGAADPAADAVMIAAWHRLVDRAAAVAPRFKLGPGDAVVVDNYRIFHGREAYADLDRLMWRVWMWTDAALGTPDGRIHSDSRYAAAQ